jgi:hypothetical protein
MRSGQTLSIVKKLAIDRYVENRNICHIRDSRISTGCALLVDKQTYEPVDGNVGWNCCPLGRTK